MAASEDDRIVARVPPDDLGWDPPAANLSELLDDRADEFGHRPYLTYYDDAGGERTELSYATFQNWVAKSANLLAEELDVTPGERVVTVMGSHWTTVVLAYACWKVGAALVPVGSDDPPREAHAIVAASGARVLVCDESALGDLDAVRHRTRVEQVVAVGGGPGARLTTEAPSALPYGEEVLAFGDDYHDPSVALEADAMVVFPPRAGQAPAGVRLTHGNLLAAADSLAGWGLSAADRLLCSQQVQLVDGLAFAHLGPLLAGGSVVLARGLRPDAFWRRAGEERVTLAMPAASDLDRLADGGAAAPESFRGLLCPTGAAGEVAERARERLGVGVHHGHGVVEACGASTLTPARMDAETRSWLRDLDGTGVGCPLTHATVAALGPDRQPLPHGVRGHLAVRGRVVMAGYEPAELDEQVFAGGWLHTGDEGSIDVGPDGREHVVVAGRAPAGR